MKWKPKGNTQGTWYANLDDRQLAEVEFARLYAERFEHGTDGHNRLLLVAKMADLLDRYQSALAMSAADAELKNLLIDSNQLLRSTYQIAARDGKDTNWDAFIKQLEDMLNRQYKYLSG